MNINIIKEFITRMILNDIKRPIIKKLRNLR